MHTLTAEAAAHGNGVDLCDLSAGEQGLDSLSDLDLGSVGSDLEGVLLVAMPAMEFSVMTGFRMISCAVFISQAPPQASLLRRR